MDQPESNSSQPDAPTWSKVVERKITALEARPCPCGTPPAEVNPPINAPRHRAVVPTVAEVEAVVGAETWWRPAETPEAELPAPPHTGLRWVRAYDDEWVVAPRDPRAAFDVRAAVRNHARTAGRTLGLRIVASLVVLALLGGGGGCYLSQPGGEEPMPPVGRSRNVVVEPTRPASSPVPVLAPVDADLWWRDWCLDHQSRWTLAERDIMRARLEKEE